MTDTVSLEQIIADMQAASDAVDAANGTSDYTARLVALALIARHFLRERVAGASPGAVAPLDLDPIKKALAATGRGFPYKRFVKNETNYKTAKDDLALLIAEVEHLRGSHA